MKRLEEIQDELAKLNGYSYLYEISYTPLLESLTIESIKKYTTECIEASLEKAFENSMLNYEEGMYYEGWVELDKDSILDKENILLL